MRHPFYDQEQGGSAAIPTRAQVRTEDTWDLSALYPSAEAWQEDLTRLQASYGAISAWKGRVGESPETLRDVLESEKKLSLLIERLYHYASLKASEDGSDGASLARESELQNLLTLVSEAQAFVEPEIMAIPDTIFDGYLGHSALQEWTIPLRKRRRLKPHTLSAAEERLLALGSSALSGQHETFSQLTNVDMKFGTVLDELGEECPLTQSSWIGLLMKRDAAVRRRAFHRFYAEFDDHKFSLAATLANSIKADVFRARARNYPSALAGALFQDDVPEAVYDSLIGSVRANLQPLHDYIALRKRLLGLSEIHQFDTYIPLVPNLETKVTFDEAISHTIAALAPLGSEYREVLEAGLRQHRWCDRYENKGKRSGAFSSSSYGNPPYLLMNYKEDVFSDVYTLAHEAGHSMHSWYAQQAQPYQTCDYPIFLAEVASTFNEELLTHHLLEQTTDRRMRAYLINRQIDDIRGTVYRQTMFAEFEKLTHAMEERGEALTLETFRRVYRGLLEAYFGADFVIDEVLELECLRIPHFYSAFYVYKYATGMSAAVALSDQVLASKDPQPFLNFLRSGGSRFPIPTLQAAGVDMSSPAPVEATLRLFAQRVTELQELLG